jgi:hypothetical protein
MPNFTSNSSTSEIVLIASITAILLGGICIGARTIEVPALVLAIGGFVGALWAYTKACDTDYSKEVGE